MLKSWQSTAAKHSWRHLLTLLFPSCSSLVDKRNGNDDSLGTQLSDYQRGSVFWSILNRLRGTYRARIVIRAEPENARQDETKERGDHTRARTRSYNQRVVAAGEIFSQNSPPFRSVMGTVRPISPSCTMIWFAAYALPRISVRSPPQQLLRTDKRGEIRATLAPCSSRSQGCLRWSHSKRYTFTKANSIKSNCFQP